MGIVAYSYLAALHCPSCTRSALRAYRQQIMQEVGVMRIDEIKKVLSSLVRQGVAEATMILLSGEIS